MKLIPLTQGQFAMVDDDDYDELSKFKWQVYTSKRHIMYAIRTTPDDKTVYMHRSILKITDRYLFTDHRDHNGLNNQKDNLRKATMAENNANRRRFKKGTSIYRGVWFDSYYGVYKVQISENGRKVHLGRFKNEIDAAKAYNEAAIKYHKEFAFLNEV